MQLHQPAGENTEFTAQTCGADGQLLVQVRLTANNYFYMETFFFFLHSIYFCMETNEGQLDQQDKIIFQHTGGLNDLIQKLIKIFQSTQFRNVKIM